MRLLAQRRIRKVGVGGVPAIISITREYWGVYIIATFIAMVLPAILTVVFSRFAKEQAKKWCKNNIIK